MNEHLRHYQGQVQELEGELRRAQDGLKVKREVEDKEKASAEAVNATKDSLIKQLTAKLKEQSQKAKDAKALAKVAEDRHGERD